MEGLRWKGLILVGVPGCLSGETPITILRGKRKGGRKYTLKMLHTMMHGGVNRTRTWRPDLVTKTLSLKDGVIQNMAVDDVIYSGEKETFTVTIEGCPSIRTTAKHPFLTPEGWRCLEDLEPGATLVVRATRDAQGRKAKAGSRRHIAARFNPRARQKVVSGKTYPYMIYAEAVIEADMNGLSVAEYLRIVQTDAAGARRLKHIPKGSLVHHKDEAPKNDTLENLQVMTKTEHDRHHGKNKNRLNLGNVGTREAKLLSVTPFGCEMTYDITMKDPSAPNFVVNGIVVHNSGKTALSEAIAGEFGVPRIEMDFGGMKDRYVGTSEANVRTAFDVVESLGGSDVIVTATCNKLRSLPAELRRRFTLGVWYFDLLTAEEQEPVKRLYETKLGLGKSEWPDTTDWSGAEIRNCAELAVLRGTSPKDAGRYIVPVAKADPESVEQLRAVADGRFLSVSEEGTWRRERSAGVAARKTRRKIGG